MNNPFHEIITIPVARLVEEERWPNLRSRWKDAFAGQTHSAYPEFSAMQDELLLLSQFVILLCFVKVKNANICTYKFNEMVYFWVKFRNGWCLAFLVQ